LFLLAAAVFILPPLAAPRAEGAAFFSTELLFRHLLHCAAALLCLSAARRLRPEFFGAAARRNCSAVTAVGSGLLAFGWLCVCAAVLQIGALFGAYSGGISDFDELLPASPAEVLLCAATFFLSAASEEAVYRAFLPDSLACMLLRLLPRRDGQAGAVQASKRRACAAISILSECAAAALFASAHRYLGAPAVVNAAAAHVFLRRCFCRTGRLAPGVLAHFCYNMGSLALLRSLS
ncbi:MAG: CPBP family intramembrane metalloprotease, partial [Treponemataceae bacterium]|nr:CPBP family intramembrane metalloprotease [Treponemataceae bacterium]